MNLQDILRQVSSKAGLPSYLSVKNDQLFYKDLNLLELVKTHGSPLEVAYTEIINEQIEKLKECFVKSSEKYGYAGSYTYAYASKANYYSEVLATVLDSVDAIETTSSYDLDIIEHLIAEGLIDRAMLIICNGFKYDRYFDKIIALREKGQNIIPILENEKELDAFLVKKDICFEVGMRFNLDDNLLKGKFETGRISTGIDSRFGFFFEDMVRCARKIRESENLTFSIFHFHLGGMIESLDIYEELIQSIYRNNYCALKKENQSLAFFDIGGGLPVQYGLVFDFDYDRYADILIKNIVSISAEEGVPPAHLIGENGRYTVNDHGFFCFKIIMSKPTKDKETFWYFINGSFMNFLPDSWALGQNFLILPLNGWDREVVKVKLGGVTCDPDDTYYHHEKDNFLYLPKQKEGEDLYIGIFGTGAYQEMISGVGGVHHCLLPEGNELIIYVDENGELQFDKITRLQEPEKVLKILDYHRMHDLKRYRARPKKAGEKGGIIELALPIDASNVKLAEKKAAADKKAKKTKKAE